jgi:hypothetical protein
VNAEITGVIPRIDDSQPPDTQIPASYRTVIRTDEAVIPVPGGETHPLAGAANYLYETGHLKNIVPALHINGGGLPSRHDAEQDCLSAIAGLPSRATPPAGRAADRLGRRTGLPRRVGIGRRAGGVPR